MTHLIGVLPSCASTNSSGGDLSNVETQAYDGDLALSKCLEKTSWSEHARSTSSISLGELSTTASGDGENGSVPQESEAPKYVMEAAATANDDPNSLGSTKPQNEDDAKTFSVLSFQERDK